MLKIRTVSAIFWDLASGLYFYHVHFCVCVFATSLPTVGGPIIDSVKSIILNNQEISATL